MVYDFTFFDNLFFRILDKTVNCLVFIHVKKKEFKKKFNVNRNVSQDRTDIRKVQ
jgi:hypothetical protein